MTAEGELLRLRHRKRIRSDLIAGYVRDAGYRGAVIFSCGNAAVALQATGIYVVEVGPKGPLLAGKWWSLEEIHRCWPDLFDATSGHLPLPLMALLGAAIRIDLEDHGIQLDEGPYVVPTGSGETVTALRWAYPGTKFIARYNMGTGTEYEPQGPLNRIVEAMGPVAGLP